MSVWLPFSSLSAPLTPVVVIQTDNPSIHLFFLPIDNIGTIWIPSCYFTMLYQKFQDVLAAYSKFYGLLLQAGFATWEEYLMDQLLLGRDNAFARAVAQGNVDLNSPVLRAVAYDLDILQQLSIPLSRLAESVSDAAPIGGSWWTEAASSAAIKSETKQLPSNAPLSALNMNMPSSIIQKPCSSEELQAWGQSISSKIEWSEGVSPLLQYYHLHGFGITSRNTALRYKISMLVIIILMLPTPHIHFKSWQVDQGSI